MGIVALNITLPQYPSSESGTLSTEDKIKLNKAFGDLNNAYKYPKGHEIWIRIKILAGGKIFHCDLKPTTINGYAYYGIWCPLCIYTSKKWLKISQNNWQVLSIN